MACIESNLDSVRFGSILARAIGGDIDVCADRSYGLDVFCLVTVHFEPCIVSCESLHLLAETNSFLIFDLFGDCERCMQYPC